MGLSLIRDVPVLEARALARPGLKPIGGQAVTLQLFGAALYGIVDEAGRLLVVIGYWPHGEGHEEVFLYSRPADELGPLIVQILRLGRLTLKERFDCGAVVITGFVAHGNVAGHRLARLVGMVGVAGAPSGYQRWEIRHAIRPGPVRGQYSGEARPGGGGSGT